MSCDVNRRGAPLVVHLLQDRVDRLQAGLEQDLGLDAGSAGDCAPDDCPTWECRAAAIRAYRGLRARGISDRDAFESSVTLYRLRHAEASRRDAVFQVAEWISDDLDDGLERDPADSVSQ